MFYYGPCDWLVCRFRFRLQQPSFHWNRKKWNVLILPTPIPSSLRLRLTTRMFYFRKVVSSLTTPTTIPTTTPSQVTTSFQRNILQHCCPHLATLSQRVATCWMLLTRVWKWSNISCRFVDVAWCCTRLDKCMQQCCVRACALVTFATPKMSQQCGPNARNVLRPTTLRSFGRACKYQANNVAIVWPGL